jgi:hypothetical protein
LPQPRSGGGGGNFDLSKTYDGGFMKKVASVK